MKKFGIFLVIGLILCAFSTAKADLLGISGSLTYPDISFDNTGVAVYDGTNFSINATDLQLTMSILGPVYSLYSNDPAVTVAFYLSIPVDDNGNLVGEGTMTERLIEGSLTIEGNYYTAENEPVTLLEGTVYAFGWQANAQFDFLMNNLGGALVDDGIWPTIYPTGVFAYAEILNGWEGSWEDPFDLNKVKGDKAQAVPEPATMLLLGSGLLGLAGLVRRKLFKKS